MQIYVEHHMVVLRGLNHALSLSPVGGKRLLYQNVYFSLCRLQHNLLVQEIRRHNSHGVQVFLVKHLTVIRVTLQTVGSHHFL